MLECEPVLLGLAVAGQQQHGARVCGLHAEQQVQEDERERIPVVDQPDDVQRDPQRDGEALHD